MSSARRAARTPFGSAVIGGIVVALFGWLAIAAGWIHSDSNTSTTVAAPFAAPVSQTTGSSSGNDINSIYQHDGQGVAFIQAQLPPKPVSPFDPFGSQGGGTATGSGFVIDSAGHVLTNNHVVAGASKISVQLGNSEQTYDATVVGRDPATDLALLKVDAPSDALDPLPLGDSSQVAVGDPVVAIGNPFGLDRTVTSGIVSALQRQIQAPNGFSISNVIQTDAAINPGNSGGPLIDSQGKVVGINSQIETGGSGSGNVGIGFAIPINTARDVISQLEQNGKVQHAFLGITGTTITPPLAQAVNLPVQSGVLVENVVKGGPADAAGLQGGSTAATIGGSPISLGGDIIVAIDGKHIASMDDVISIVNGASPGKTLDLSVLRNGQRNSLTVTLGDRPNSVKDAQSQSPLPGG
jgi:S1-C subfamily serine protease